MKKRSTCHCNLYCIFICFQKICKEWTFWIVSTVSFINKENALKFCVIWVFNIYWSMVFLKLLNIYDHYFQSTFFVFYKVVTSEICHKFISAGSRTNIETSTCKFVYCLFHKSNTIYDEIELYSNICISKVVCQTFYRVISKSCFTRTLCMPDDSTFYSFVQSSADCKWSKHLLVAHNVFLKFSCFFTILKFYCAFNISKTITKQEKNSFFT